MKKVFISLLFILIFLTVSCENSTAKTRGSDDTSDTEGFENNDGNENAEEIGSPVVSWTKQWGTEKNERESSVATGIDGSVYVAGYIINDMDYDLFLTKFSSDGTEKWTRIWGTEKYDYGKAVTVGSDGSIYVTGYSLGSFNNDTVSGVFLTKFRDDGTKEWTKQWEGMGKSVALGRDGSIYITGDTMSGLDGNTIEGGSDAFLMKLNSNGIKEWIKQWGTNRGDAGKSVATGDDGSIFVVGNMGIVYEEYVEYGEHIFLAKFKSDGTEEWIKQWGTEYNDFGSSVAVGSDGYIYVAGYSGGDLDGNNNEGREDVFLTKFSNDGKKKWTKLWGTESRDFGYSIAAGSDNSIYVTGYSYGGLNGNDNGWGEDVFLTKFSNDGTKKWTKQWGTSSSDRGYSVAVSKDGSIYITGLTGGFFDGFVNEGGWDFFLTKIIEE